MLPAALFQPFNTPRAETYTRLLLELYAESRRASQPLRRDLVLDLIIAHSPPAADPLPDARETLSYLEACGWLRIEIQPDYQPACVLTPQAFQFLQALICPPPAVAELLVTIGDLLKAALLDVDNEARLGSAVHIADQLFTQLKLRQHNAAADSLPDTARLREAALEAAARLEARGYAQARLIRERLESLDRLLADIAARQSRGRTGRDRPDPALAGQLSAVIQNLAAADKKAFSRLAEPLVNLYGTPAPAARPPEPAAPDFSPDDTLWPQPTQAEISAARAAVARQFNRPVSPDRLRHQAEALLHGRPHVRAADLVLDGKADLPLLIQFRLHGDGSLGYTLEDQPWVELNGLVFRDFVLRNPNYSEPPAPALDLPEAGPAPATESESE